MRIRRIRRLLLTVFSTALLCLLASCTSAPEATRLGEAAEDMELPGSTAEGEAHAASGLDIRTTPDRAAVYMNNRYMGATPLLISGLDRGRYRLRLVREDYRTAEAWIRYDGSYLRYEFELERITGFLQVRVLPDHADIRISDRSIAPEVPVELPAGSYDLKLKAFGYEDTTSPVTISDGRITAIDISLPPAAFRVSPLSLSRQSFNPADAGSLGRVTVGFRVTAPGSGSVIFLDPALRRVHSLELKDFTTSEQSVLWAGTDDSGASLPDGSYLIRLQARGSNGAVVTRETAVTIDRTRSVSRRSLWSGASGLLFAPTPEILPPRTLQVSTLALGRIDDDGLRAPWSAGLRLGLNAGFEIDAQAGFIVGGDPTVAAEDRIPPFFASSALKVPLFAAPGPNGFQGALLFKLAYQHARTDTLSNFMGLSASVPCVLRLGGFLLVAAPQLLLSPWSVAYDRTLNFDGPDWPDWSLWLYGRAGLLYESGGWQLGLSSALRSTPLSESFGLDTPFQAGLELHRLVPGTQLYLTLVMAAELGSDEGLYAGVGLDLID